MTDTPPAENLAYFRRTRAPLLSALPAFAAQAVRRFTPLVLLTPDRETADRINADLWSFDEAVFVPHGGPGDPHPERQPLWIVPSPLPSAPPNGAQSVLAVPPFAAEDTSTLLQYPRLIVLFSQADDPLPVRALWQAVKDTGREVDYREI